MGERETRLFDQEEKLTYDYTRYGRRHLTESRIGNVFKQECENRLECYIVPPR